MKTVVDLVETFKQWDKLALIHKTGYRTFNYSYGQLYEKVQKTAAFLDSLGLKKGDRILLWGLNCPEWVIIFLASAYRGVVVVPIDFLATGDFVEKIQAQVNAKVIFRGEYKMLPKQLTVKDYVIEHLGHYLNARPAEGKLEDIKADDLLEIVFTSGTTGDPKGVMITHGNLISNVVSIKKVVDVRPEQTFLSLLPLSHLFEQNPGLISPLSSGCTIVYMRGLRPNLIFKALKEVPVTNIVLVPRLLKLFETSIRREVAAKNKTKVFDKMLQLSTSKTIKKLLFSAVHKKFGRSFEYFISGGAPLSDDLQLFWKGMGFEIVQGYGLTECSPVLTINPLMASVAGSVGRAAPGIELKLNDKNEVYARGANITAGYYKRADKTAELFDNGWMKTGDIGSIDENGYLFLKGRAKDMIVTAAGMNVYAQDVEEALGRHSDVKEACVIGLPGQSGEQVHAELLLSDPKADIRKVVAEANSNLNDSQQITSYGVWASDDFPRTTTMKIKKMLVLAEVVQRNNKTAAPTSSASTGKLQNIIARVCEVDPSEVKPSSSLALDLRLSSISRVELIASIEQEFNLDIDEDAIDAKTTVATLEEMIRKRAKVESKQKFHRWLLSPPLRAIRAVFNTIVADNIIRLFVRRKIIGLENVRGLKEPVIFISNHVGYFDAVAIIMTLPWRVRNRIAPAAWKEYFETDGQSPFKNKRLRRLNMQLYYPYAALFVNCYPFSKKTGFTKSLEYTGELLDKRWNILFFPEGEHSPDGSLQPFRSGIGWIVKELKVPVVLVKHAGFEKIMAGDAIQMPRFGRATIKFSKPIQLDDRKSIPEIVNDLQNQLKEL